MYIYNIAVYINPEPFCHSDVLYNSIISPVGWVVPLNKSIRSIYCALCTTYFIHYCELWPRVCSGFIRSDCESGTPTSGAAGSPPGVPVFTVQCLTVCWEVGSLAVLLPLPTLFWRELHTLCDIQYHLGLQWMMLSGNHKRQITVVRISAVGL